MLFYKLEPNTISGIVFIESSTLRQKGEKARLESHYVVSAYKCVSFQYYMYGKSSGRLNVLSVNKDGKETLLWRLAGKSNDNWQLGKASVKSDCSYKVGILFQILIVYDYCHLNPRLFLS